MRKMQTSNLLCEIDKKDEIFKTGCRANDGKYYNESFLYPGQSRWSALIWDNTRKIVYTTQDQHVFSIWWESVVWRPFGLDGKEMH